MCFSAQASFIAGVGLLGLGVGIAKRVRSRCELPYALIPLLFGLQQLLEGALWLSLPNHDSVLNAWLTNLYLFFSNVLWPVYVPLAVLSLETVTWRRRVIAGIATLGTVVSIYLLALLALFPTSASIAGQHILYEVSNPYEKTTIALYVFATCASLLFSSHRRVVAFGVAAFASEVVAYVFYQVWFISVWCFFAAVLSIMVLWYFQGLRPLRVTPNAKVRY